MFVRIVKIGFHKEYVNTFLSIFNAHKLQIRHFEGCRFLELYRDKLDSNIFFTYSYWDSEDHLEMYRQSELFNDIWGKTKILFDRKPEAWSVDKIESLN
ncbi:putative quinol monooxygenase [Seonamhaeicola sp. ML3]|uniref:putative quinol monooxygenase n=1 Tax=Seonamhaeicola sp. ML3 TaxID=2937786 RepID=UPI00200F5D43|nr:antibiotic biosynthesis monooxygenase family protein [Seonamhaeicola sp. ML3]